MRAVCLSIVLALSAAVIPVSAQAVAQRYDLNIPRQPLDAALKDFAYQTGLQIARFSDTIDGSVLVGPVVGDYSAEQALLQLLQAGGLSYEIVNGSTIAIIDVAGVAQTAETSGAGKSAVEEILVTASRVGRPGFRAPTPTTVIDAAQMQQAGRTNVAAALNDVPQFRGTLSPQTTAGVTIAGTATADLRGIGSSRTLVLVNGQRQVVSNTNADFDLNTVPFNLVERVEVVTGGASAAWGSGAVAGVVNILLDEDREGLELSAQHGVSSRDDVSETRFNGSYGTSFADGRGHVLISAEYVDNGGIERRIDRNNVGRWARILNPAYTPTNGAPQFLLTPDISYTIASTGGLIVAGPLAGTEFGPGGVPRPFQYGPLRSGAFMSGGVGVNNDDYGALMAPVERISAFGRLAYDLTDSLRVSGNLTYAKVDSLSPIFPENDFGSLRIQRENAFMPQAILDDPRFVGQTGITIGRSHADFGIVSTDTTREMLQASIALDGSFAQTMKWNAYYAHGESDISIGLTNLRIASNFAESVDSVISPTTGQPVCRVALTNPSTNCVPVNLFGAGSPSQAALDYFLGRSQQETTAKLDVVAATLRGDLFALWAGPVSFAAGVEYRKESIDSEVDALSAAKRFMLLNVEPLVGEFSVKEAFAEVVVPLARDLPLLRTLDFNGAVRASDYSTTGEVTSWKVGLTDELFSGFRFRATRSRDIRAANLVELFQASSAGATTVSDPFTNTQVPIVQRGGGNPQLDPEFADTLAAGFVYEPPAISGLGLSLDYYDIDIDGAVATIGAQDIINRCFGGNTALCSRIIRNPAGAITDVISRAVNLANYKTSGFDFETYYSLPLSGWFEGAPGNLSFRVLANYIEDLTTNDGVTRTEPVGQVGSPTSFATPHWRGSAAATYSSDSFSVDLRGRYVGGGYYVRGMSLNDNDVPSQTYIDLGFQYRLPMGAGYRFTLYGNVANLFDREPPKLPNTALYDVIGRYYSFGLRANL